MGGVVEASRRGGGARPTVSRHVILGSDGAAFETARAARERGYEPLVLVPRGASSVRRIPGDIDAADLDPRDVAAYARHFEDAEVVYYCCGTAVLPIDEEEPERLAAVVRAAGRAGARLVYCDAPYAYGITGRTLSEDMPARARDPFGSFLAALAQFVQSSHQRGDVQAVLARHGDLFGPQVVRSSFGEAFVTSVLDRHAVNVLGRAGAPRTITYAPDLGRALVLLGEHKEAYGQLWHLPSAPPVSPQRLVGTICAMQGIEPAAQGLHEIHSHRPLMARDDPLHKAQRSIARLYEASFTLSSAKFERAFGMHATSFKDQVFETVGQLTHA
jgi:nucleoside-diphosphate-sugar epimerase